MAPRLLGFDGRLVPLKLLCLVAQLLELEFALTHLILSSGRLVL
jgi:hypothetical protein